jgi:DNA repair exonuclease SbcCD nuclease subunit
LKLDVPVFIVPGNHDGWTRYDQLNESLEED